MNKRQRKQILKKYGACPTCWPYARNWELLRAARQRRGRVALACWRCHSLWVLYGGPLLLRRGTGSDMRALGRIAIQMDDHEHKEGMRLWCTLGNAIPALAARGIVPGSRRAADRLRMQWLLYRHDLLRLCVDLFPVGTFAMDVHSKCTPAQCDTACDLDRRD